MSLRQSRHGKVILAIFSAGAFLAAQEVRADCSMLSQELSDARRAYHRTCDVQPTIQQCDALTMSLNPGVCQQAAHNQLSTWQNSCSSVRADLAQLQNAWSECMANTRQRQNSTVSPTYSVPTYTGDKVIDTTLEIMRAQHESDQREEAEREERARRAEEKRRADEEEAEERRAARQERIESELNEAEADFNANARGPAHPAPVQCDELERAANPSRCASAIQRVGALEQSCGTKAGGNQRRFRINDCVESAEIVGSDRRHFTRSWLAIENVGPCTLRVDFDWALTSFSASTRTEMGHVHCTSVKPGRVCATGISDCGCAGSFSGWFNQAAGIDAARGDVDLTNITSKQFKGAGDPPGCH